jgi:hypothetical protein
MTLKRKAYQKMLAWKNDSGGAGAFALDGARCVGKSALCGEFGKNEYKSVLVIDCRCIDREAAALFEGVCADANCVGGDSAVDDGADLDAFFAALSAIYQTRLFRWESLVVFDDAQCFSTVLQMLGRLVADRRYDYIVSGASLLGFDERVELFPLDFEEFLWATGDDATAAFIRRCFERRKPLGKELHRRVMNDFLLYALVGGMPQAVSACLADKDFAAAEREKERILALFRDEMVGFGGVCGDKATAIFDAIPSQLSCKSGKFKLSAIGEKSRTRACEDAFARLDGAKMIYLGSGVGGQRSGFGDQGPGIRVQGLGIRVQWSGFGNQGSGIRVQGSGGNAARKVYMADAGLLATHAFGGELHHAALLESRGTNDRRGAGDGMLLENAVAQALRCNGHRLHFYSSSGAGNPQDKMEIDFLLERDKKTCPVSMKTSVNRAGSSLDKFREKFAAEVGEAFVLYPGDVMVKNGVVHLPFYMAMCL